MNCEFCNKQFSTKGNTIKHQLTAKYCIKLQEESKPRIFKCDGCKKILCSNDKLQKHQQICKKFLENDKILQLEKIIEQDRVIISLNTITIEKLEKHILELENKLVEIAIKSTTKTTNISTYIQQNFTPITDESLARDAKNITMAHISGGGEAIANVFLNGSMKNNVVCTDTARRILQHKDENGNHIRDVNAIIITKRAFSSIIDIAREIRNKCTADIDTDDDDAIEQVGKIISIVSDVGLAINGQTNDVSNDFAKAVCIRSNKTL